eukprot:scaffold21608_cov78-Skeletonema_dohrnii-CCMP3373.AAC.1
MKELSLLLLLQLTLPIQHQKRRLYRGDKTRGYRPREGVDNDNEIIVTTSIIVTVRGNVQMSRWDDSQS